MSENLVVVESPAKASTIKKYLGADFDVLACYGHVRDLRPKKGAVEPEHGFRMHYEPIAKGRKHVDAIASAMRKAKALYLATDLDREGEAISWHLVELLKERDVLDAKRVHRVVFHEITRRAIEEAMGHTRDISMELVNAQQARRALDYLVGFNLSPLLWKKIKRGLSAGRVQSPALRLIVEREEEIERFKAREYWSIEADARHKGASFVARLTRLGDEKLEQFSITNEGQATQAKDDLLRAARGHLRVTSVEKKQRRRQPAAPFITSTLQQEAVRKLGFTANRTMRVAQQLYEGVDIGSESVGLITYMRTDSVNLAGEAIAEIRSFVRHRYGAERLPEAPRVYKTNAKNAQEAHEAIRPTSVMRTPESVKSYLGHDQFKLYELVWKRTVACQMTHATIDSVAVDLDCGGTGVFRANGSTVSDPGFMTVYMEGRDEVPMEAEERMLPPLVVGDDVQLQIIRAEQHFTEPPPRYTEASLVKTLEEHGIGRPSTYASIISTLQQREYVEMDVKRFRPTDIGRIVARFLTDHFGHYVDYEFTAKLEDELDAVSRGEKQWVPLLSEFWKPFKAQVLDKETNVSRREVAQARDLGADPKSGQPVSVRMGRYGPYVQIGSADGGDKPRFVSLRPGQRMDTITLDEALALAQLPRALGSAPDGHEVVANIGRFGPYLKHNNKYVSLRAPDDPYTITLDRAWDVIRDKQAADAAKFIKEFPEASIRVLNGRYGPYVTDGKRNARVPKDCDPATLPLNDAQRLLANAPASRRRAKPKVAGKAASE
ncbi:MAG: DNA topoisomerase I [Chromatiales bacterium]